MEDIFLKWFIPFLCGGAVSLCGMVLTMWKRRNERDRALRDGVQCMLRMEIIRAHDKYIERSYCPIYAKDSLKRAYEAYHTLDGNDVATNLYNEIMGLPTEPHTK